MFLTIPDPVRGFCLRRLDDVPTEKTVSSGSSVNKQTCAGTIGSSVNKSCYSDYPADMQQADMTDASSGLWHSMLRVWKFYNFRDCKRNCKSDPHRSCNCVWKPSTHFFFREFKLSLSRPNIAASKPPKRGVLVTLMHVNRLSILENWKKHLLMHTPLEVIISFRASRIIFQKICCTANGP
jgi:hypothetical protein